MNTNAEAAAKLLEWPFLPISKRLSAAAEALVAEE
jgi:hypothetical protein